MSDSNGDPVSVREVIDQALEAVQTAPDQLLSSFGADYPMCRLFLLGGMRGHHNWPAGTVSLKRVRDELVLTVRIPCLEVEASYSGQSFYGLFEMLETDLCNDTIRWRADWRRKQREERKLFG